MKRIKQNRLFSFVVVALIYILTIFFGVYVYCNLKFEWWLSILIADILATIVIFIFSLIFKNASVYDPYWSVHPPVILIAFAIGKKLNMFGIIMLIVVLFWAIRLTANWAYTFKNLNHQDWRYTMLKEKCGVFYPIINLIGIQMVQTLIVYGCILPGVYAIRENLVGNVGSILFLCLSLMAVIMQGISDIQMHMYRKDRKEVFIRVGFWKHSRHPNYLGEILMWWGVGLSVLCAAPNVWYLILGAFLNTVLFLAVSIPMADNRQSHKEGFETYKRQTRMLLPIKKFTRLS